MHTIEFIDVVESGMLMNSIADCYGQLITSYLESTERNRIAK